MRRDRTVFLWAVAAASSLLFGLLAAAMADQKAGSHRSKVINTTYRLEIEFATGRADIKPKFDADIRRVAREMQEYPYVHCEIRGYTDNVGSDLVNLKLSQQRAESVRQYIIKNFGISPMRIVAKGYGKEDPIASNRTADGRRQNRRIMAVIRGQPPGEPDTEF
jgi:outer membrane protein OmpA-like peptidoglycan-associated protein